ncbi:response regulator containing a CheY-like receiver domain and a GGDEF domain [Xenococcus sp. PCC 7305]|uniref:response regulator n=1 Tax=Xenococcus sp. PCC 7305 TaxID=102125 RepID=UPI0002ACD6E4|nr:response regulator [Xenococcus sp. PCC 7305]ELS05240.1 response regulator containing a CheY-like receiver domain and a GGDEF domain [Xenococcus sp. PCC 7305]
MQLLKMIDGSERQCELSQIYKPLILIVDNDCDNLFFASCVIKSLGMRYLATDNGEECLRLVYELLPDLILLDIVMPKINGLEIIVTIRQTENISHIPIIAVTGLTRPEDIAKIIEGGCDDYLVKPYLIEDLEEKIHRYLKYY